MTAKVTSPVHTPHHEGKEPHVREMKAQGRKWTLGSKKTETLNSKIYSLKILEKAKFSPSNYHDNEENYQEILKFRSELVEINNSAHQYNQKWYIKFLSLFSDRFKLDTLDPELGEVKETLIINHTTKFIEKLDQLVLKHLQQGEHVEGFLRLSGDQMQALKLTSEVLEKPEVDLHLYNENEMVSALKKMLINLPDHVSEQVKKTGLDQAYTIDRAILAYQKLPEIDNRFCKDLIKFLVHSYEYSWKRENTSLDAMIIAIGIVSNRSLDERALFPNIRFLIENYSQIFEPH